MTEETQELNQEIQTLKEAPDKETVFSRETAGYNATMTILTDLFGCILVGGAIGLFLQYMFQTSVLLTAGLTLLGGVSGLYTTVRYAMRLEQQKEREK